MLILGIDPGTRFIGYGLIEVNGRSVIYKDSGVMKFEKIKDFMTRLKIINQTVKKLISSIRIDEVAIESLIYVKDPRALIKLGQATGSLLSAVMDHYEGVITEYTPNFVKASLLGHGHADKLSIQKSVNLILGPREYKRDDESDALAIAICHMLNMNNLVSPKAMKLNRTAGRGGRSLAESLKHCVSKLD